MSAIRTSVQTAFITRARRSLVVPVEHTPPPTGLTGETRAAAPPTSARRLAEATATAAPQNITTRQATVVRPTAAQRTAGRPPATTTVMSASGCVRDALASAQ